MAVEPLRKPSVKGTVTGGAPAACSGEAQARRLLVGLGEVGSEKTMTPGWVERDINLKNKHALHMRPAQRIVEVASKFQSDIRAVKDNLDCDAKSILDMIGFAAHMVRATAEDDHTFRFRARGKDAKEAIEALGTLINDRFGLE
jgi:phosphocarrier protein